ncbi:hypothetical protein [Nonomuraea typhae]|uniref:hypothetical protein n=1 Tax=Nonomuraea typhae TaxID=2603600 RepID=UPI0012FAD5C2|nr:hypothetical protein [Nonomuraea typhae]
MAEINIPRGPIDSEPVGAIRYDVLTENGIEVRRQALLEALTGVPLGAHDHAMVDALAGWDTGPLVAVCSWLDRVREAPDA